MNPGALSYSQHASPVHILTGHLEDEVNPISQKEPRTSQHEHRTSFSPPEISDYSHSSSLADELAQLDASLDQHHEPLFLQQHERYQFEKPASSQGLDSNELDDELVRELQELCDLDGDHPILPSEESQEPGPMKSPPHQFLRSSFAKGPIQLPNHVHENRYQDGSPLTNRTQRPDPLPLNEDESFQESLQRSIEDPELHQFLNQLQNEHDESVELPTLEQFKEGYPSSPANVQDEPVPVSLYELEAMVHGEEEQNEEEEIQPHFLAPSEEPSYVLEEDEEPGIRKQEGNAANALQPQTFLDSEGRLGPNSFHSHLLDSVGMDPTDPLLNVIPKEYHERVLDAMAQDLEDLQVRWHHEQQRLEKDHLNQISEYTQRIRHLEDQIQYLRANEHQITAVRQTLQREKELEINEYKRHVLEEKEREIHIMRTELGEQRELWERKVMELEAKSKHAPRHPNQGDALELETKSVQTHVETAPSTAAGAAAVQREQQANVKQVLFQLLCNKPSDPLDLIEITELATLLKQERNQDQAELEKLRQVQSHGILELKQGAELIELNKGLELIRAQLLDAQDQIQLLNEQNAELEAELNKIRSSNSEHLETPDQSEVYQQLQLNLVRQHEQTRRLQQEFDAYKEQYGESQWSLLKEETKAMYLRSLSELRQGFQSMIQDRIQLLQRVRQLERAEAEIKVKARTALSTVRARYADTLRQVKEDVVASKRRGKRINARFPISYSELSIPVLCDFAREPHYCSTLTFLVLLTPNISPCY
jgi:hypothetical protein